MMDLSKYPKVLKTREDYEFIMKNFPAKYWQLDFRDLILESINVVLVGICDIKYQKVEGEEELEEAVPLHIKYLKNAFAADYIYFQSILDTVADYETVYCFDIPTREVRKYIYQDKPYYIIVDIVEKSDSKMKRLGYTMEEAICLSMGIIDDETVETMQHLHDMEKSISDKLKELDDMEDDEDGRSKD